MDWPYVYSPDIWLPLFTFFLLIALCAYSSRRRSVPGALPLAIGSPGEQERQTNGLTERQTEVLRLVAKGLTYREVGERLSLSERTVRFHMTEIISRLHL